MGAGNSQPEASQPQSQPAPKPEPKPQPQAPAQPQPQAHAQPQPQPQPQAEPQPQPQPQPQPHQRTSREGWLLLPGQGEAIANTRVAPKPSGTPISLPPAKPLEEQNFPHKYQDILKDADTPVDKSRREKLFDQLYAGVFLDHKTKKYWVEKKSNCNCFMLYARALSITWAENQHYWKWVPQEEASRTMTEVAELKRVCWLEVHGRFDTRKLSPGFLYEVSFLVMLKDPAQGWEVPVNVRLVLPRGKKQERKENLMEKSRVRWIEIPVGQFVASAEDAGEMEFSIYEYEVGIWKQGLVIKGVAIKPKN